MNSPKTIEAMTPEDITLTRLQIAIGQTYPDMNGWAFNGFLNRLLSDIPSAVQARMELDEIMVVHPLSDGIAEIVLGDARRVKEILDRLI